MKVEITRIVFVCVENARRSQMAEGFAKTIGGNRVQVYSAGSSPSGTIDPLVIEVMKERGIDITSQRSKGLGELPDGEMDYVVMMGCEDSCPVVQTKNVIQWQIPDPKGHTIDFYRRVRDILEEKVRELLSKIGRAG